MNSTYMSHGGRSSPAIKKRAPIAALLSVAAALFLSACNGESSANQNAAPSTPQAMPVEVMYVQPQDVANAQFLPGRAQAYQEAEIRPQVTGLIQRRLFTEGETVEAGEALYQIDEAEYAAAFASAQASLARAEAQAGSAGETLRRFGKLSDISAVSQQDYDNAYAASKQADADVAVAAAALRTARINLERTTVTSPISGRIGRSTVTPGALVTQNQSTAMARVVQLDPIYIDLTVSSSQLLNWRRAIRDGQIKTEDTGAASVSILLENGETYPHRGRLEFTEVNVDEEAGSVVIRATAPNPEGLLLPGMFVKAELEAGTYLGAFLLPQSVVTRTPQGQAIAYVVDAENKIATRVLQIAQSSGSSWIVTGGLEAGDAVVISGFHKIRPGAAVIPQEAEEARLSAIQNG